MRDPHSLTHSLTRQLTHSALTLLLLGLFGEKEKKENEGTEDRGRTDGAGGGGGHIATTRNTPSGELLPFAEHVLSRKTKHTQAGLASVSKHTEKRLRFIT